MQWVTHIYITNVSLTGHLITIVHGKKYEEVYEEVMKTNTELKFIKKKTH